MAELTPTTSAVFIPEIWAKEAQMFVKPNLVMADLVMRFDADTKQGGDTLHIPKVTKIAAAAKSDDTDVTFTAPTEGEISLSLNKNYYAAFKLPDITRIQSAYDLRSLYTKGIGQGLAEQIDSDLASLYSGLSQSVDASGGVTDALILTAIQYLDDANAPDSDRHFVFKPSVKKAILALDKFVLWQNRGENETINKGKIGEIYGIQTYVSTAIKTSTTVRNLMFHREAFALAMQSAPKVEAQYMARAIAWEVVASTIYGVVEYRDSFGVEFKS